MTLSENIRAQRKRRGLTQEQLAEAMNVSTAAVSKWETSLSTPDIDMVLQLADYFELSVDALLGYTSRSRRKEDMLTEAANCIVRHEYARAIEMTEDALRRYPNHFDVVLAAARCHLFLQEENHQRRALKLLERAMELFPQQKHPKMRREELLHLKGCCLRALHDCKGAIACFEEGNLRGVNDQLIADCRTQLGEYAAALPLFSYSLMGGLGSVINSVTGMADCLMQDRPAEAIPLLHWCISILDGLDATPHSYVWKIRAILYTTLAIVLAETRQPDHAQSALRKAAACADRFDAAPDFSMAGWHFFYGDTAISASNDTLGETAREGIRAVVQSPTVKPATRALILSWLDEV